MILRRKDAVFFGKKGQKTAIMVFAKQQSPVLVIWQSGFYGSLFKQKRSVFLQLLYIVLQAFPGLTRSVLYFWRIVHF